MRTVYTNAHIIDPDNRSDIHGQVLTEGPDIADVGTKFVFRHDSRRCSRC